LRQTLSPRCAPPCVQSTRKRAAASTSVHSVRARAAVQAFGQRSEDTDSADDCGLRQRCIPASLDNKQSEAMLSVATSFEGLKFINPLQAGSRGVQRTCGRPLVRIPAREVVGVVVGNKKTSSREHERTQCACEGCGASIEQRSRECGLCPRLWT
jgi:hypothetical protein